MKRATGIGGVFFKSKDVPALNDWYKNQLGFEITEWGAAFDWADTNPDNKQVCSTAWSLFKEDSKHFAPTTLPYMINYRVHDLKSLIDALREEKVEVVGGIDEYDYGKFAWIMDPEGRKIELWEPIDSGFGEAPEPWNGKVIGLAGVYLKSEDPSKTKAWYKKHLGVEDGFSWIERNSGKEAKTEWNVSNDLEKPFAFAYYTKDESTSTVDPEGNEVVLKKI